MQIYAISIKLQVETYSFMQHTFAIFRVIVTLCFWGALFQTQVYFKIVFTARQLLLAFEKHMSISDLTIMGQSYKKSL